MLYILLSLITILVIVTVWFFYRYYKRALYINKIITILKDQNSSDNIIIQNRENSYGNNQKDDHLKWKLFQAGIDQKEYLQTKITIYIFGIVMVIFPFFFFERSTAFMIAIMGILISIFAPSLYLDSAKSERVKKIDHDLSSFLDLIIIILESGGGLKNSLNFVASKANNILSPILINEIKILESQLSNYDSATAYDNLAKRTGSKYIISMVDFLKLAEETGMGVKTIFENQAKEIKDAEFFEVEKKAATVNLALTVVVFLFLLPALAAFIILPMRSSGGLMGGF